MIVAIDGPAGSGKSTVARAIARDFGFTYLDTGAMYRCVALAALERGVPLADGAALEGVARSVGIGFGRAQDGSQTVSLDGRDVTLAIRTPEVDAAVSTVSAVQGVRDVMVALQRALAAGSDAVAEGRDIGTVVFPEAEVKVFLTAEPARRAPHRRADQNRARSALARGARSTSGRSSRPSSSATSADSLAQRRAPEARRRRGAHRFVRTARPTRSSRASAPWWTPCASAAEEGSAHEALQAVRADDYFDSAFADVSPADAAVRRLRQARRVAVDQAVLALDVSTAPTPSSGPCPRAPRGSVFVCQPRLDARPGPGLWRWRCARRLHAAPPLQERARREPASSPGSSAASAPFPSKRGTADMKAIRRAVNALKRGENVLLFPEGTRIRDPACPPRAARRVLP